MTQIGSVILFFILDQNWYFPKSDYDCWLNCGKKGGTCEWCGENGYCCSGFRDRDNADCPSDAVNYIITKTSQQRHMCIAN